MKSTITFATVLALSTAASGGLPLTITETFDGGSNEGGWTWGFGDSVPASGGNPGPYLRTDGLDTFAPQPRTTSGGLFIGDFRARGVNRIGVDLATFAVDFTAAGRPLTLMLLHDNGTPAIFNDDTAAYRMGANVPLEGQGWISYEFPVQSSQTDLPPGWLLVNLGDSGAPPIHSWDEVIQDVTQVKFFYGDPTLFFIFQQWTLGMDNVRITYVPETDPCPADTDGSGTVDGTDLVNVILDWGTDGSVNGGDVDGSGTVDGADLVAVILAWGQC